MGILSIISGGSMQARIEQFFDRTPMDGLCRQTSWTGDPDSRLRFFRS